MPANLGTSEHFMCADAFLSILGSIWTSLNVIHSLKHLVTIKCVTIDSEVA